MYPYENFLSVVALAWQLFVLVPFSVFLLGALVRFLVFLHSKSKWPSWTAYAVFLPFLLVLECVLGLRQMLILNVKQITWFLLNPYQVEGYETMCMLYDETICYDQSVLCKTAWRYQPLHGLDFLWLFFPQSNTNEYKWLVPIDWSALSPKPIDPWMTTSMPPMLTLG